MLLLEEGKLQIAQLVDSLARDDMKSGFLSSSRRSFCILTYEACILERGRILRTISRMLAEHALRTVTRNSTVSPVDKQLAYEREFMKSVGPAPSAKVIAEVKANAMRKMEEDLEEDALFEDSVKTGSVRFETSILSFLKC
jgi:hypothetical protein